VSRETKVGCLQICKGKQKWAVSKRQTNECVVQFTHVTTEDPTVTKISEAFIKLTMCGYIMHKLCEMSQSLSFKEDANKLVLTYSR
jgi:hypothetical protein